MPPRLFRLAVLVALFRALSSLVRARAGETADLESWKGAVRARFPNVPQIQTAELGDWLAATNRIPPLLLDVRTPAEFRQSHLPGAQRVDPGAQPATVQALIPSHRPVVVYCSVGWRSSELAERLRMSGLTNVMNLEGSIFAWANEHRPLEADGHPVTKVHPYNATFGRLLHPDRRATP